MKRKLTRIVVGLALVAFAALWLKELSQRLARDKADTFMGPLLTVYTCTHMHFLPWFTDADRVLHGPTWLASYDSHLFLVDFPPQIAVSSFGDVTGAYNAGGTNDLLSLSEEDRDRQQWRWVKAFHDAQMGPEPNKASEDIAAGASNPQR